MSGALTGRRILLVEDEYLIAMEMERWLQDAGAEVVGPVPSVEQALDVIEEVNGALDAAVLDINLSHGELVYPVADRLKELGVPYLFATGDVRVVSDQTYREQPRLEKPVLDRELLGAMVKLIGASHPKKAPL
ncbi:response regulator (plasmid) [Methylobacterium oryzae CBMB20]